ncbi:hypothetical protein [Nonlabens antarcticus]|uniref:hypothetical protein n=1 Tax=Nonlabens antarcticus TaxID=392714 RepID=UPI00189189F8|nr:hypothetical protein [Nonlabens antarcticus]
MSKLTDEQVNSLFKFTRQHFVEFYDLQTELVDHMANGIETLWLSHPDLTFEQARDREFKKFGVFGFMNVVEKRQAAMGSKYNRIVWKHFKEYMKVPKIVEFALAILATYFILKLSSFSEVFFLGGILMLIVFYIIGLYFQRRRINKNKSKSDDKKWMFKEMIYSHGALGGIAIVPLHFFNIFSGITEFNSMNDYWFIALSITICSFYLFLYIMIIEIPKRAEEYLEQTYPEYKFAD